MNTQNLQNEFIALYGSSKNEIEFSLAPARVNIIGEHIDYNGGLVFPAAIDLSMLIALRKRQDKKILYSSFGKKDVFEFSIEDNFIFQEQNSFANYLNGMIKYLQEDGLALSSGFEVLIASDIPAGSGLSSSAALEVGFGVALCSSFNFKIENVQLAKIGKRVENEFLGLKSGIMDQFAIAMGKKNEAVLLNTSTLEYEYVPFNIEPYKLVVMNSNRPRKLTDSKYNERKAECEKGLSFLQKSSLNKKIDYLCDLTLDDYVSIEDELKANCGDTVAKRVKHCFMESSRVEKAVVALRKNDLVCLGHLLNESHISLKYDYEVTGKELDALYTASINEDGCLGARMTGAGFSGCAIAIVHKDACDRFAKNVGRAYTASTGLNASFFACYIADGVHTIAL